MRDIEKELNEARRDANNATRYAEPGYANLTAYAKLLEIRALRLTIEKATQKLHEHHRGTWVRFTDHEAAIEQAYSDGESSGAADWQLKIIEVIERHDTGGIMSPDAEGIMGDLRALTQPQTERCPEDCDGFGRLIGDSDGPCPACSGLESDGGGAATAAGVADADPVARITKKVNESLGAELADACDHIRALIGGDVGAILYAREWLEEHDHEEREPGPYAKAFRERVCPVPEFPGIEKEES